MIYLLLTKIEYGQQDRLGQVLHLWELDEEESRVYAHGLDQALGWAKSYTLWADVEPDDLAGGRYVFCESWRDYTPSPLFDDSERDGTVTHTRQSLTLEPLSTVYETYGYEGGDAKRKHH